MFEFITRKPLAQAEPLAGAGEGEGPAAGAVIGHDARYLHPEAPIVSDCSLKEDDGAVLPLIGEDLREGDARGIVDRQMHELPADAAAFALAAAIAGDAVADLAEAAELLDVDVDFSFLAEIALIGYRTTMSVLLRKIARYAAQKVASDPDTREKLVKVARSVMVEAKQVAREDDRAYAAGRAFRRAFDKLQK